MSKEQFDLKKTEIEAIPAEEILIPNMPVAIALQESEDLFEWCQEDKSVLIKAGLDWFLVDDLPARTAACRYIQSLWQKDYKSLEEEEKEWIKLAPAGYELRNNLVHNFLHGYHKFPDLLSKTQKISEGTGHADMIQDLSDLSVLGKANPEPLIKSGLDISILDTAALTSEQLASLLAKVNGARNSDNKLKLLRDKAYTFMKQAVDEIRRNAHFAFWHTPERDKGYISQYYKSKKVASKKIKSPENTK